MKSQFDIFVAYSITLTQNTELLQENDTNFDSLVISFIKSLFATMLVLVAKNKKTDIRQVQQVKKEKKNMLLVLSQDDYKEFESY